MARRADTSLTNRLATLNNDMRTLELDLRNFGDLELADVVKRARRELQNPAFTGPINTLGVNHGNVRN